MGDEIGNGGELQKIHFCLVKKIGGVLFGLIGLVKKIRGQIWLTAKNWRTDPAYLKKLEIIFVILFC